MTDSMKFGPEWLRNMKSGDSSGSGSGGAAGGPAPPSAPVKMAEWRYGREEMLALFDRNILPPDPLRQLAGLFVKETQPPLALVQMTEEETRMWNRGINSDAALRLSKPGAAGAGPGGGRGALGGRGGSVDRGRGRARGSYHYSRGLSYDDTENTNGYVPRGRNYDRTQSGGGWGERNGGDTGDSPRKEFGTRSLSDTNWRRHRGGGGEEEDGWRGPHPQNKWGRGNSNSWREGEGWEQRGARPWDETNNSHPPPRRPWDSEEGNLPEWAMENPSESGGSFDASGAFHGGTTYSDEEDANSNNHQRGSSRSDQNKTNASQPRPAPQSKKEPPNITNGTSSSQESGAGDRDSSTGPGAPLRQSQSATSLATAEQRRPPALPHPITTSASFSGVNNHPSLSGAEGKPQRDQPARKPEPNPLEQHSAFASYTSIPPKPVEEPKPQHKPSHEDEMEQRLLNDADVFVSRLMEEEEREPLPSPSPSHAHPTPPLPGPTSDIKWVYQDPQGEIQGNFSAVEMTEWYSMGYFKPSLLVRRTLDEVFLPISEMKRFWKADKPFEVDYQTLQPIKKNQAPLLSQGLPPVAPPLDESALLLQLQLQQQLMHQRQQALLARLSQSEQFNSLSALEQRQMLAQQASLAMDTLQGGLMLPHLQQHAANPQTNSNVLAVLQMLAAQQQQQQQQLQQQQQRLGGGVAGGVGLPPTEAPAPLDPLQQMMSLGLPRAAPAPATPQNTPEEQRSFDQFLQTFRQRQAAAAAAQQPQQLPSQPPQPQPQPLQSQSQPARQPVVMESVWGGPASAPAFPGWSVPPGHPPAATVPAQSLWADPIAKGIKTEADILEEQMRAEEKLKKEELRKQEELLRLKQEEEERERLRRLKEEEELKRQEEEERERERERKRVQEAEERKKKEAAAAKKAEQDRLRKEEEKKRKEEEKRRKEEEKRKQEEEKKKAEEERKRQEEEKRKQEEIKRSAEALRRMQEQQQAQQQAQARAKATPAPWTPAEPSGPSLADIQKTERQKQQQLREQQQQLREQQELLRQYQQQHQQQQQQQRQSGGLNLKWAEAPAPQPTRVKSLAEIQQEEQERLAKQAEKEKAERMAAAKDIPAPATGSIWQSATQSLTWNSNSPTSSVWGPPIPPANPVSGGGARFFDEERKAAAKPPPPAQAAAKPPAKTKAKKEEATVMRLFEKQLAKTAKTDEFNRWCAKVLHDMVDVDIPTFVDFLWTVESQAEIQEYSCPYLNDPPRAAKFAAEFTLRRQRLLSNNPADRTEPPVAPPSNNFQEVKGKNKKLKKKNMTKVDSRILGFNVTAAPDRINVGDRDYGENV